MSDTIQTLNHKEHHNWIRFAGFAVICIPAAAISVLCLFNNVSGSGIGDVLDLGMDILGSLVCVLLYYGCMSAWDSRASYAKTFILTLFLNALTLFLDTAMWALSGNPALRNANLIVSVLFYITDLLLFYQFWRYARAILGLDGAGIKKIDLFLKILLIPGIALCISNFFTPVLFSISENGVFLKAPGYPLGYIYMLITFLNLIIILFRGKIAKWQKILTIAFSVAPIVILVLTRNLPDVAVVYTVASVSILLHNCVLFTESIRLKELIIRLFSFLLLAAMLICGPMLYRVSLQITSWVGYERAEGAFALVKNLIDEAGFDQLSDPDNTELYQRTREKMREICRAFRLENLYVETIDPDDGIRHFVIVAAASDEADAAVLETLGWPGATIWNEDSYITVPEQVALTGSIPENYSEQNNEYGHNLDWFCPYKDANGNVTALIGADYEVRSQQAGAMQHTIFNVLPVLILYLITLLILIRILGRTFIDPIHSISRHIENFLSEGIPDKKPIKVWGGFEIERLAGSFKIMTSQLSDYEEKLKKETAERERISTELNLASSIQSNQLPNHFPAFPDRREFDLYAIMQPAKEVGGDFYDFFLIDEDHLAIAVADVSGKGVPAALFMMLSKTMLKTAVQLGFSPAGVLEKVNEQLAEGNDDNMFVTVWLGILEISTGKLTYADAGHEKPILYRNQNFKILNKKVIGMPLGMMEPLSPANPLYPKQYHDQVIDLLPGDMILQYSDGVPEACDSKDQFFGENGLISALNGAPAFEPDKLLPHIFQQIKSFVGDAPQFDDITLLCMRYNTPFSNCMPNS